MGVGKEMIEQLNNSIRRKGQLVLAIVLVLGLMNLSLAFGSNKKKKGDTAPEKPTSILDRINKSKLVWPQPPNIARIKYLDYFAGEKLPDFSAKPAKQKVSWMDRVAGTSTDKASNPLAGHFFMGEPHGLAVDSTGKLYVADTKVGAIFIINPETHDTEMIKNGKQANFAEIYGLAIDDTNRLFVSDGEAHRVLLFGPQHEKVEAVIREGLVTPAGLAIDNENRFLYVTDIAQDLVLVYDADDLKLLRKIGTPGKDHTSTENGDFAKPSGVAVDKDGNVYVADMLNARIEIFDADGNFIRAFGKRGDGVGYFSMPKGIAVDCDGHIWVTDAMQNRLQVFSQEGDLLIYIGNVQGILPGMFSGLQYVAIDNNNRVFTSEVFPGRVQEFRYVTQEEAREEYRRREAEKKSSESKPAPAAQPAAQPAGQPAAPASPQQTNDKSDAKTKDSAAKSPQTSSAAPQGS